MSCETDATADDPDPIDVATVNPEATVVTSPTVGATDCVPGDPLAHTIASVDPAATSAATVAPDAHQLIAAELRALIAELKDGQLTQEQEDKLNGIEERARNCKDNPQELWAFCGVPQYVTEGSPAADYLPITITSEPQEIARNNIYWRQWKQRGIVDILVVSKFTNTFGFFTPRFLVEVADLPSGASDADGGGYEGTWVAKLDISPFRVLAGTAAAEGTHVFHLQIFVCGRASGVSKQRYQWDARWTNLAAASAPFTYFDGGVGEVGEASGPGNGSFDNTKDQKIRLSVGATDVGGGTDQTFLLESTYAELRSPMDGSHGN